MGELVITDLSLNPNGTSTFVNSTMHYMVDNTIYSLSISLLIYSHKINGTLYFIDFIIVIFQPVRVMKYCCKTMFMKYDAILNFFILKLKHIIQRVFRPPGRNVLGLNGFTQKRAIHFYLTKSHVENPLKLLGNFVRIYLNFNIPVIL